MKYRPEPTDPVVEGVVLVVVWVCPVVAVPVVCVADEGALRTVTCTVALPVAPPLSVAVSWKVYVPGSKFETTVEAELGETMVALPVTCVHLYAVIVLPLAAVPKPESVTLFVGAVIVCADPAFAVGPATCVTPDAG